MTDIIENLKNYRKNKKLEQINPYQETRFCINNKSTHQKSQDHYNIVKEIAGSNKECIRIYSSQPRGEKTSSENIAKKPFISKMQSAFKHQAKNKRLQYTQSKANALNDTQRASSCIRPSNTYKNKDLLNSAKCLDTGQQMFKRSNEQSFKSSSNTSLLQNLNTTMMGQGKKSVEDIHCFLVNFHQQAKKMLNQIEITIINNKKSNNELDIIPILDDNDDYL